MDNSPIHPINGYRDNFYLMELKRDWFRCLCAYPTEVECIISFHKILSIDPAVVLEIWEEDKYMKYYGRESGFGVGTYG